MSKLSQLINNSPKVKNYKSGSNNLLMSKPIFLLGNHFCYFLITKAGYLKGTSIKSLDNHKRSCQGHLDAHNSTNITCSKCLGSLGLK